MNLTFLRIIHGEEVGRSEEGQNTVEGSHPKKLLTTFFSADVPFVNQPGVIPSMMRAQPILLSWDE